MPDDGSIYEIAQEIADEVVDHFSTLYPAVRMNRNEWAILHEMISREVRGHFGSNPGIRAIDLLPTELKD